MKKRITAAILALIMLLASAGCTSDEIEGSNQGSENDTKIESNDGSTATEDIVATYEKPTLLTEVFAGSNLSLPSGYEVVFDTAPYYNSESGELTIIATKGSGTKKSYKLVVYDRDMNITSENDITLESPSKKASANNFVVLKDCIYCLFAESNTKTYETTYVVAKYSLDGESLGVSQEVNGLFDVFGSSTAIKGFSVSDSEYIYIATSTEVLVLNSDYVKQCSIASRGISSLAISQDGDAYALAYFENSSGSYEQGITKINLETKDFDDYIKISGMPKQLLFAEGHDFYVFHQDGVYGYDYADDGSVNSSIIMDFQNSDITYSNLDIISVLNAENIIATYSSNSGSDFIQYAKSDDIDISTIKLIEIACVVQTTTTEVTQNVLRYNSEHKDSRIIVSDYSGRSGSGNDFSKLVTDILNGLYVPDLILVYAQTHIETLVENGIYTDLNPYIDADERFDRDDIFDSVYRNFSLDGKMWGIGSAFEVGTLVGKTSLLGDRTSWTYDEFIDYALSLPDGQYALGNVTQSSLSSLPGIYNRFVDLDNYTCNFENEEFYKTLEFISSLPTESIKSDPDNSYSKYQDEVAVLSYNWLYGINMYKEPVRTFNTDELTYIGYPTNGEDSRGGNVTFGISYIIPSTALNKDAAWDYISDTIVNDPSHKHDGFSVLKDTVREQCEAYYNKVICFYFSGGSSSSAEDPENPMTEADLREPGVICRFTEEDTEDLVAYLNDGCGSPLSEALPEQVLNIINEEITSYLSGAKTAEACAKVIQSRVGIYLAENQ